MFTRENDIFLEHCIMFADMGIFIGYYLYQRGMLQHHELGQWLRNRYITDQPFLSQSYQQNELRVISTNFDRTIMSANSNLQGLYPRYAEVEGGKMLWKPIPVHAACRKVSNFKMKWYFQISLFVAAKYHAVFMSMTSFVGSYP